MLYGLIFEMIRDTVLRTYGPMLWKRLVTEVKLPSESFEPYARYDDQLMIHICDSMAEILNDGIRETHLEFFGDNFIHYFSRFGFYKIFRVAGRTFADFLYTIDQLHDSNRFTFPQMQYPLFHVTKEDEKGVTLVYKSIRQGLSYFAIGALKAVGKLLFNNDTIRVIVQDDLSTIEYSYIVLSIQFDNKQYRARHLFNYPSLPEVNGSTFFRVFPFSILLDSKLCIRQVGERITEIFPENTPITGRQLDEVFQLIRPDIHLEWEKILSYGRHIIFLIENRIPLRNGPSGRIQLKGQMKYLPDKNMLWFLCHPVLGNDDDIRSAGLHLADLNLFDNTSDLLVTGIHQERELEASISRQHVWMKKAPSIKRKLRIRHKKNQALLYSTMPKHIAFLLQSGMPAKSICECQPLVTIMFVYVMDLKSLVDCLDAAHAITCLNEAIILFDRIADKFDVFKVEIKADASYMIVAGIHDQSHMTEENESRASSIVLSAEKFSVDLNEEEDDDEEIEEIHNKNPLGYNSTEIIAALSLELEDASRDINNPVTNKPFDLKFGVHTGSVIGGIVGTRNYQYCLFGETVRTASQITLTGEIGRIHLSKAAYCHLVSNNRFRTEYRGQVEIKGKGLTDTYWLISTNEKASTTSINKTSTSLKCPFTSHEWTVQEKIFT